MTTPVIEELYNSTGEAIDVLTAYPSVFANNPSVRSAFSRTVANTYDRVIDLDLVYERSPRLHSVTAYSLEALGHSNLPSTKPLLYPSDLELATAANLRAAQGPYIVMHLRLDGWPSKNVPQWQWYALSQLIFEHTDFSIVIVGSGSDLGLPAGPRILDLRGRTGVGQLAAICDRAEAFVGVDSGPMHIASSTRTPVVGLFTAALPEYRAHTSVIPIVANIECAGCLHDLPAPQTEFSCARGDSACRTAWDIEQIYQRILDSIC